MQRRQVTHAGGMVVAHGQGSKSVSSAACATASGSRSKPGWPSARLFAISHTPAAENCTRMAGCVNVARQTPSLASRAPRAYSPSMFTVVETSLFQKQWPLYWTEDERGEFAAMLAASPEAGVVVKESGGIRKVRWKRKGAGKSGGVRVIYFMRNEAEEIVLLTLYAKSDTDNINGAVLKEIRRALED